MAKEFTGKASMPSVLNGGNQSGRTLEIEDDKGRLLLEATLSHENTSRLLGNRGGLPVEVRLFAAGDPDRMDVFGPLKRILDAGEPMPLLHARDVVSEQFPGASTGVAAIQVVRALANSSSNAHDLNEVHRALDDWEIPRVNNADGEEIPASLHTRFEWFLEKYDITEHSEILEGC